MIVDTTFWMSEVIDMVWTFWLFSSKLMGDRCNKCKVSFQVGGDTWCTGCAAWETIGLELCNSWSGPAGLRRIAEDVALSAARQIRALRAVGAGSSRAPAAGASSGVKAEEEAAKEARPAAVGGLAAKSKVAEPEDSSEEEYTYTEVEAEEEREEDKKEVDTRPTLPRRGREESSKRPLEERVNPAPLSAVKEERREDSRQRERGRRDYKERERGRKEDKKERAEKKSKTGKEKKSGGSKRRRKRGGRKHQRLSTLAEDPFRPHHRKLSDSGLEGRQRLDIDI